MTRVSGVLGQKLGYDSPQRPDTSINRGPCFHYK